MSQPVETTPDLTFTMSESSKDTENAADKTEGSIAKSFQDAQQPKANVRGSMIGMFLYTLNPWFLSRKVCYVKSYRACLSMELFLALN
jgi:hypothetical protein